MIKFGVVRHTHNNNNNNRSSKIIRSREKHLTPLHSVSAEHKCPSSMDIVLGLWTVLCWGLALATGATLDEHYSRHPGIKYVVPGSWTVDCPQDVSCSVLFCARQCTCHSECRSFSHSKLFGQCVFNPWYFLDASLVYVSSQASWSTYEPRKFGVRGCGNMTV